MTAVPPRPAAPDATAGDGLRSAIDQRFWGTPFHNERSRIAAAVLALPALRDVLAAAARDAEKVAKVRELAQSWRGVAHPLALQLAGDDLHEILDPS